jgi:hypothetical protein
MNSVQLIFKTQQRNPVSKVFFVFILLYLPFVCNGQHDPETYINQLTSEYRNSKNDSLKIEKLSKLADYYYDYLGDKILADSTSQEAIELAESSYKPGLLLLAYNRYIEINDGMYLKKSLNYALEAVRLSKQLAVSGSEWRSNSNLVKVYLAAYQYNKALGCSYQALALADGLANNRLKAESYLLIGQSLEGNNQKIEAFRNYLNASAIAEKLQNTDLLKQCYAQLSGFYNLNKLYDKAITYKLKQVDLILKSQPVDSTEYMWAQYDLQAINLNSNNNRLNTNSLQQVLDFALRNKNIRLKNYEIALYRSHLIEADDISQLDQLYTRQYPAELQLLATTNPAMYYRLKAYFSEEENRTDSAYYYLTKAEYLLQQDPNKILRSNFYQRFGQFLVRQGKPKAAIEKYKLAYDLSSQASYFDYMLSASKKLESLYSELGDYKNAYTYSALNHSLDDSITMLTKNDQLLMLEIDHETKQRELAAEQEQMQTHRRHNIQYTAITIIIIALFIILMMLGSLKVPSWTIKMLGFFSFILFFEFIIMIADHKIYEITANEPWKILLIKIGLIAFLLPFHHWIEKKVTQFLIEHKLIKIPRLSLQNVMGKLQNKGKQQATDGIQNADI